MEETSRPFDAVIIGGGVTGLALGTLLARREPSWRILVLERADAAGGKMRTLHEGGYRIDTGPLGILPARDGALALARSVGVEPRAAAPAAKKRWLFASGGLRPLPTGPGSFLTSELLNPFAKMRAAAEPLVPPGDEREETVHAFLARRFGHGLANRLGEALVLGVTGGDPRELSLDALFPRLRGMEREHGSLLRALLASSRAGPAAGARPTSDAGDRSAEPSAARGRLHGFGASGMQALSDALARSLGPALRTGAEVRSLTRQGDGWQLALADGERLLARRAALAVPAFAAAPLVRPLDAVLADGLAAIPYASMRVIGLGYDRIDVPHPLDGFGFLVPAGQDVRSLGVLFTSSLFPEQAPPGKAHLRVLAGGRRDPGVMELEEGAAVEAARRDLRVTLGVAAEPEAVTIIDWPRAIPQYALGHRRRIEGLLARAGELAGLQLAGSAYFGVGVNDCVRDAHRVADAWSPPDSHDDA